MNENKSSFTEKIKNYFESTKEQWKDINNTTFIASGAGIKYCGDRLIDICNTQLDSAKIVSLFTEIKPEQIFNYIKQKDLLEHYAAAGCLEITGITMVAYGLAKLISDHVKRK